ncbi:podoplanin [Trachinotus anak]|uniref:podoplanin n=1 Tax=Trachinotus anak TaxID=443729 RepID=UPI0039F1F09F
MMNVQLLLLLALVGPFCASPILPTGTASGITSDDPRAATEASGLDHTVVTGAPATEPATAPAEVTPEAATEAATLTMKVSTEEAPLTFSPVPASTEASIALNTDHASVESAAPTAEHKAQTTEVQPQVTTAATGKEPNGEVLIEDSEKGGLSSGQVVGIVIGALLAVVIVVAVVIAAVRRMGKYSP